MWAREITEYFVVLYRKISFGNGFGEANFLLMRQFFSSFQFPTQCVGNWKEEKIYKTFCGIK